ncbi:MAG: tRNA (adenosine(37)-N6)-threonylcarbamoyltransferase complex ATPase subunit type 1 TsaE [Gammaproteobacteria bacterium]|nr:tRNA (adenosine(37)-N6)-threonylcarbamoyltransferase complex ATPase subunit type 1 TsaE [Gammaproteobacteria bacterium]
MSIEKTTNSPEETMSYAKSIAPSFCPGNIYGLNGQMASGKTTFIKGLLMGMEYNDMVNSPTFTLINEYQLDQTKIFHYDLYKIKRAQELIDIGINDYLNQNALHFFEWPKNCASLLPRPNVIIDLINVHSGRLIKVTIKPNE